MVPNELIPPAKFNLCEPVSTGPSDMANGLAAVCCKQNPIAIINNDTSIRLKEPTITDGTINMDPITEINNPQVRTGFKINNGNLIKKPNGALIKTLFGKDMKLKKLNDLKPLKRETNRKERRNYYRAQKTKAPDNKV